MIAANRKGRAGCAMGVKLRGGGGRGSTHGCIPLKALGSFSLYFSTMLRSTNACGVTCTVDEGREKVAGKRWNLDAETARVIARLA